MRYGASKNGNSSSVPSKAKNRAPTAKVLLKVRVPRRPPCLPPIADYLPLILNPCLSNFSFPARRFG